MKIIAAALAVLALGAAGCASEGDTVEDRAAKSVALYKRAVEEIRAGNLDDGIARMEKANEIQPGYTQLRWDLAQSLIARSLRSNGESLKASAEAKKLRDGGKEAEAKAKDADAKALYDGSVRDLRDARGHLVWLAEGPMSYEAQVHYVLAQNLAALREYKLARQYLEKAIDIAQPKGDQLADYMKVRERLKEAEIQEERLRRP